MGCVVKYYVLPRELIVSKLKTFQFQTQIVPSLPFQEQIQKLNCMKLHFGSKPKHWFVTKLHFSGKSKHWFVTKLHFGGRSKS